MTSERGRFIVIEGGDACGKNTQALALHQRLTDLGSPVPPMFLSFPRYATPLGQAILRHLKGVIRLDELAGAFMVAEAPEDKLVFQCMMSADKYHAAADIEAHLARGGHVVCDRWWQSAYVYGTSDGLDEGWLREVHRSLPQADAAILIDLPSQQAVERRPAARDRYEGSMFKRTDVRNRYLEFWRGRHERAEQWPIVYGAGSVEEVSEEIWNIVKEVIA